MLTKLTTLLSALTALVHIIIGGADSLQPTLAADLPLIAEAAMHACWHIISALLLWSIFVFWRGGKMALDFGLFWIVAALVFIYVGLVQGGVDGLMLSPQWTILGGTGILVVLNQLRGKQA
ncbi:MAG: hypothetical protein V3V30_09020 [Parvularculaceae bacterium]